MLFGNIYLHKKDLSVKLSQFKGTIVTIFSKGRFHKMGEGIFPLISGMHKITWSLPPPPSIDCWRALALVAERQMIHKQLRRPKKRVWTFSGTPSTEIKSANKYALLILPVVAYSPCVSTCPGIECHCFIISLEAPRFKANWTLKKNTCMTGDRRQLLANCTESRVAPAHWKHFPQWNIEETSSQASCYASSKLRPTYSLTH